MVRPCRHTSPPTHDTGETTGNLRHDAPSPKGMDGTLIREEHGPIGSSGHQPSDSFLSLFQNTHEDLSSLFCSELVAAAYQRMGLIKNDRPSNTYTPDDFSSARDASILNEGVELGSETYIELKWPRNYNGLSTQESVY